MPVNTDYVDTKVKNYHTHRMFTKLTNFFSKEIKAETNNQGKSSVTFFKQFTGIPVPVSHKKVPFRLQPFLNNICIPPGTNSYSGPWTTLELTN